MFVRLVSTYSFQKSIYRHAERICDALNGRKCWVGLSVFNITHKTSAYAESSNNVALRHTFLAAGLGLEPRLMEPESIVLPLDDPANYPL